RLLPAARPPRDPHSFPTRRSSDLYTAMAWILAAGLAVVGGYHSFALCARNQRIEDAVRKPLGLWLRDNALADGVLDAQVPGAQRSEEHTSELQSLAYLVCRLLLEK